MQMMIKKSMLNQNNKTVFILGAGASSEVGLPLGDALTKLINKSLSVKWDQDYLQYNFDQRKSNDLFMLKVQNSDVQKHQVLQEIKEYKKTCLHICQAMPATFSIDDFLNANRGNEKIKFCGKLGIILNILEGEKESLLSLSQTEKNNTIDIEILEKTWYMRFWKLLVQNGCEIDQLKKRLQKFSIISFNYDRCIERFLILAVRVYYAVTQEDAEEVLEYLDVIHPYGYIGSLLKNSKDYVPYGADDLMDDVILSLVDNIQTYSEGVHLKGVKERIENVLQLSDTVVLLGFGFHSQNMCLLKYFSENRRQIFATTKGYSAHNEGILHQELQEVFRSRVLKGAEVVSSSAAITNLSDATCSKLFDEYWLSFTDREF
jgi:hypothetical protein